MSIRRRLIPVFAILIAGISLRIFRTVNGLEWSGGQKVVFLIIGALVLTFLGNAFFNALERRK